MADNENTSTQNAGTSAEQTSSNNTNNGLLDAIKEVRDDIKNFFSSKKEEDKSEDGKTESEEKPSEPTAKAGDPSDARITAMQEEWKKEKSELKKQIKELKETQEKTLADADATRIKNGILKAKEVGFILPDDKLGEDWLTNILVADYDGTMQKIESLGSLKNAENGGVPKENVDTLAKSIANNTMSNFY